MIRPVKYSSTVYFNFDPLGLKKNVFNWFLRTVELTLLSVCGSAQEKHHVRTLRCDCISLWGNFIKNLPTWWRWTEFITHWKQSHAERCLVCCIPTAAVIFSENNSCRIWRNLTPSTTPSILYLPPLSVAVLDGSWEQALSRACKIFG